MASNEYFKPWSHQYRCNICLVNTAIRRQLISWSLQIPLRNEWEFKGETGRWSENQLLTSVQRPVISSSAPCCSMASEDCYSVINWVDGLTFSLRTAVLGIISLWNPGQDKAFLNILLQLFWILHAWEKGRTYSLWCFFFLRRSRMINDYHLLVKTFPCLCSSYPLTGEETITEQSHVGLQQIWKRKPLVEMFASQCCVSLLSFSVSPSTFFLILCK